MPGLLLGGINTEIVTGNISITPKPNKGIVYVANDDTIHLKKSNGSDLAFQSSNVINSYILSASGSNTTFTSQVSAALASEIAAVGGTSTSYVDSVSANLAQSIADSNTAVSSAIQTASGNLAQSIATSNTNLSSQIAASTSASLNSINGITSPTTHNINISGIGGIVIDSVGTTITVSAAPVDLSYIYSSLNTLASSASNHEIRIETLESDILGASTILNGSVQVFTDQVSYHVSHVNITGASYPVVSLVVPTSASTLYIQGVYNISVSGFDVVLSGLPSTLGYAITWQRNSPGALNVGGSGGIANSDVIGTGTVIITATQSIVPAASAAFDLGSALKPWKDLYLSGNSLHLGNIVLSSISGSLAVGGSPVAGVSEAYVSNLTGNLQSQINTQQITLSELTSVSGTGGIDTTLLAALTGSLQSQIDSNTVIDTVQQTTLSQLTGVTGTFATQSQITTINSTDASQQATLTQLTAITGSYSTNASVASLTGSLQTQITAINSTDASQQATLVQLTAITGTYSTNASVASLTGSLQSQITANASIDTAQQTTLSQLTGVTGTFATQSQITAINSIDASQQATLVQLTAITGTYASDANVVHKTGDESIAGKKTFSNDVTINANLFVNGTQTIVNTTQISAGSNQIVINSNETGPGVTAGYAGIRVDRGTAPYYDFQFRESDDAFVIGMSGSYQAVATREDSPLNGGVARWDSTAFKFITVTVDSITSNAQAQINANTAIDTAQQTTLAQLAGITGSFTSSTSIANLTGSLQTQITAINSTDASQQATLVQLTGVTGTFATQTQITSINSTDASQQATLVQLTAVTGSYSTNASVANLTGSLQSQITANTAIDTVQQTTLAQLTGVTGTFATLPAVANLTGSLQTQITANTAIDTVQQTTLAQLTTITGSFSTQINAINSTDASQQATLVQLTGVTGTYLTNASVANLTGSLQSQITANTAIDTAQQATLVQLTGITGTSINSATVAALTGQLTPLTTTASLTSQLYSVYGGIISGGNIVHRIGNVPLNSLTVNGFTGSISGTSYAFRGIGLAGARFQGYAYSGTTDSPSAVVAHSELVDVVGFGYDSTGYGPAVGSVRIQTVETFSPTSRATLLQLNTTNTGATTESTKLCVWHDGSIQVGGVYNGGFGTSNLVVAGSISANGSIPIALSTDVIALSGQIVKKSGDTMTGNLAINKGNPFLALQGAREWDLQSVDSDGRFRIYDGTGNAERFSLYPNGGMVVYAGISANGNFPVALSTDVAALSGQLVKKSGDVMTGSLFITGGQALSVNSVLTVSATTKDVRVGILDPGGAGSGAMYGGMFIDATIPALRIEALEGGVAWRDIDIATRGGNVVMGTDPGGTQKLRVGGTGNFNVPTGMSTSNLAASQSIQSWSPAMNSQSEIAATTYMYYNGGVNSTFQGALIRQYDISASGVWGNTSITLSGAALFLGQNGTKTLIGTNGSGPIQFLNGFGETARFDATQKWNFALTPNVSGNIPVSLSTDVAAISGQLVKKSGDTMTGNLVVNTPASSLPAQFKGAAGAAISISAAGGSEWRIGDGLGAVNGTFVVYDYANSRHAFMSDNAGNTIVNYDAGQFNIGNSNSHAKVIVTNGGQYLTDSDYYAAQQKSVRITDLYTGDYYIDVSGGRSISLRSGIGGISGTMFYIATDATFATRATIGATYNKAAMVLGNGNGLTLNYDGNTSTMYAYTGGMYAGTIQNADLNLVTNGVSRLDIAGDGTTISYQVPNNTNGFMRLLGQGTGYPYFQLYSSSGVCSSQTTNANGDHIFNATDIAANVVQFKRLNAVPNTMILDSGIVNMSLMPTVSGSTLGNTVFSNYGIQSGSFVDPGGSPKQGDIIYVL